MPAPARSQQPRLLEDVRRVSAAPLLASLREVLRALACPAMFDNTASRQDLMPAEPKIQAFLIHLAVDRTLPAATQKPGHECARLPLQPAVESRWRSGAEGTTIASPIPVTMGFSSRCDETISADNLNDKGKDLIAPPLPERPRSRVRTIFRFSTRPNHSILEIAGC